jgi:hypothetical protein
MADAVGLPRADGSQKLEISVMPREPRPARRLSYDREAGNVMVNCVGLKIGSKLL